MVDAGMFGLDTPRTVAANETMADFDITQEPSFHQPAKDNDLVRQMRGRQTSPRKATGGSFKTPARRRPLGETRNPPPGNNMGAAVGRATEFTPLMRSVTKSNHMRAQQALQGVIATPAALKPGHVAESPALPMNSSGLYDLDHTSSSIGEAGGATPVPQLVSSSVNSTPLAALPRRDGGGTLADGGQMMTLREQEKIIDKIEKENFGLKLKIHFLQEQLRKSGPGFNEAALKENTDLKVDKVTLQHDLKRYRKTLAQAERDLDLYRQQLAEIQEKLQKRHLDAEQKEELERLRADLADRESEIEGLRQKLENVENSNEEVDKLKDNVADLEADLREKERQVDAKEDEIEGLKEQCDADAGRIESLEEKIADFEKQIEENDSEERQAELVQIKEEAANAQAQLEDSADEIDDLKRSLERMKVELEEAKEEMQEAVDEKERAVSDLEELQGEMANKSFTTKGLSRQLEEKTAKLQDDYENLREEHQRLQESSEKDAQRYKLLEQQLEDVKEAFEAVKQKSTFDIDRAQHERDVASKERDAFKTQAKQASDEQFKALEEKDLLQSKYDVLESESQNQLRQVQRLESSLKDSNEKLRTEQDKALLNDRKLRDEAQQTTAEQEDQTTRLRHEIEELEEQHQKDREDWKNLCRAQEVRAEKAEAQASGLQRTVDSLQNSEGTLHGREMRLQEALESEKARYENEKGLLSRQVEELEEELESKKRSQNELRSDLLKTKEELRQKSRGESSSSDRIQALEDEIEVLQLSLDEQAEQARAELSGVRAEADTLRRQLAVAKADLRKGESARFAADASNFGGDFDAELAERLQTTQDQLLTIKKEKQAVNDQLANTNIELHALKQSSAELEAERDELRSQMRAAQAQVDGTLKLDQEKLELRRANLKLENALTSAKDERQTLRDNCGKLETELADEIKKASALESRLTRKIQSLEHQIATSSPQARSPAGNSSMVMELRNQLAEAYDQLKAARTKFSEARQSNSERSRDAMKQLERERSMLETELAECRQRLENVQEKEAADNLAISRLRRKVARLEKDMHGAKLEHTDRSFAVAERAELHALLKASKMETEAMKAKLQKREAKTADMVKNRVEAEMQLEIERLREDRSLFSTRAHEANMELQRLQQQGLVPKGSGKAQAIASPAVAATPQQHAKELKGLTKQIVYLQARLKREMTFRSDLAFSKKFFLMQTEMFSACNNANINILEEMGLSPRKHISGVSERPSFKSVATAVRAMVRMKRGAEVWGSAKKLRSQLEKGLESVRRKR